MRYLLLLVTLICISCGSDKKNETTPEEASTTTYYLIRHAEKDRTAGDNPVLTAKGKQRADFWATHFKEIPLDAVYSTDYVRTKQTAAPTAERKNLPVKMYDPKNLYSPDFQEKTKGKTVLVVGHSNTTPAFVNSILGEHTYPQISDTENALRYKVVVPEAGETIVTIEKFEMQ